MEKRPYICPKCGNDRYLTDQLQATGGNFAKLFDIQNKRYTTVSCTRCGYTEFYRKTDDSTMDVMDFLFGGR